MSKDPSKDPSINTRVYKLKVAKWFDSQMKGYLRATIEKENCYSKNELDNIIYGYKVRYISLVDETHLMTTASADCMIDNIIGAKAQRSFIGMTLITKLEELKISRSSL